MTAERRPHHLPSLDGLRAVAVAAVVAFHLGRLPGGFIGVDLFFVISGFLITRLLLAERDATGTVSLRAFWARRVRRLLPAVLVVVPVTLVAARLWLPGWRLPGLRDDALAALAYVANWRFVTSGQSYFASGVDPSPLRHTWSLAVEEQFYVLWPLLVLVAIRLAVGSRRAGVAVLCAVLGTASAGAMAWGAVRGGDLTRLYYGTDTRLFALIAGALVATGWDRLRVRLARGEGPFTERGVATVGAVALGLLGVAAVLAREDHTLAYLGGLQVVALLGALAVAGLAVGVGPVARALSSPSLRWVGRRSYGIYLWSWPVQILLVARFPDVRDARIDVAVVAASVALAALSFRYLEAPVVEGRPLLPWAPARGRSTGGAVARARPVAAASVAVLVVVAVAVGAPAEPDFLTVSNDEVSAAALSDEGFAPLDGDATPVTAPPTTAPPDTSAPSAATADAPAGAPPLDPGPVPPLPLGEPVVARPSTVRPEQIHGRSLRVLVVGDSVAWSVAWEAEDRVEAQVDLSNRALLGCGLLPPDARWLPAVAGPQPYPARCQEQAHAEELGFASQPDVVLLWLGAWEVFDHEVDGRRLEVGDAGYGALVESRLQSRVDRARAGGFPTVMPVVPCFDDAMALLFRAERLDPERVGWVNDRIRAVADRNPGWVRLIDPGPVLCDADGASRRTNETGLELRPDGSHFTADAAAWLWDTWLGSALAAALSPRT